jgi:hypothetical protein
MSLPVRRGARWGSGPPDASAFPGEPPRELPDERGEAAWWWGDARDDGDDEAAFWQKREIKRLWRAACERCRTAQWIPTPTGYTLTIPFIRDIVLGHPTWILVELRAGQLPSEIEDEAPRIAATLGVRGLRVRETGYPMWLRIEFSDRAEPVRAAPARMRQRRGPLGRRRVA